MQSITDVGTTDVDHLEDDRLLGMARMGDIAAFDALYRRHVDWARRTARWHLRSSQAADDVVSEAFMATLRALQNGRGPSEGFRTYLRACIRNQCISLRKRDTGSSVEWVDGSEYDRSHEPAPDGVVAASPIVAAFRSLNPRWQQALMLTAVHELDPDEAAARMGMCTNAMNTLTYRAREALAMAYVDAHVGDAAPACAQVATKFARYVRGQACARDIEKVEAHLASCSSCSQAVAELRDLNQTLRALPFVPMCPPVVAVAVGLSWTGKAALVAGLLASASAVTTDHPILIARPAPTRAPAAPSGNQGEMPGGTPNGTTPDGASGHGTGASGADRAGDDRPSAPGDGTSGPSAPVDGVVDPASDANSPAGAPTGSPVSVPGGVTVHGPGAAGPGESEIAVTVPTTVPSSVVGGIVDLVTDLTGIDPTAPIVNGTVSLDPSGIGASVDVGVVGIDAGVDVSVDLDEGTNVTIALPVSVPNVLPPVVTIAAPPLTLPPLPTVPSLPPLLAVPPLPPPPTLPSLPLPLLGH